MNNSRVKYFSIWKEISNIWEEYGLYMEFGCKASGEKVEKNLKGAAQ